MRCRSCFVGYSKEKGKVVGGNRVYEVVNVEVCESERCEEESDEVILVFLMVGQSVDYDEVDGVVDEGWDGYQLSLMIGIFYVGENGRLLVCRVMFSYGFECWREEILLLMIKDVDEKEGYLQRRVLQSFGSIEC